MVVITGDLIDYKVEALPLIERLLGRIVELGPKRGEGSGVAAIFGNHDYHEYSWRHIGERSAHRAIHKRLVRIVEGSGARLLRNEQMRVKVGTGDGGGGDLVVVGLDEMWTGRADGAAAFRGLGTGEAIVCLQHNPDGVEFFEAISVAGHVVRAFAWGAGEFSGGGAVVCTDGAAAIFGGVFWVSAGGGAGEGRRGGLGERRKVFVSRGLGHSTPIRWCCRPEATLFTVSRCESRPEQ